MPFMELGKEKSFMALTPEVLRPSVARQVAGGVLSRQARVQRLFQVANC
jgi:hypothetical protein